MVFDFAVGALAVLALARLNRLAVRDIITAPLRHALKARAPHAAAARWATALLMCHWCTGIWFSAAVTAYVHHHMSWSWWLYPVTTLAIAQLASDYTDQTNGILER
ncbi:hypothetical protein [Streptomyces sp. NBRC 109706]|uniref:hypothetical protein n=1 Tax=Streptomyces sp. NBRC 109706 TaxID=1550035 RepID=UPI000781CE43|nr:hypothetical protein [Streptomyces sp. NBRC 109706]